MRNWANIVSWSRLALIIPISALLYFSHLGLAASLIVVAMLTDYLDGVLARKLKLTSAYGSALDGTIDIIFAIAIVAWLWTISPTLVSFWPYVLAVQALLLIIGLIVLVQNKPAPTLHLWTGKIAMTLVYLLIPLLVLGVDTWFIHVVGIACLITQFESILYVLSGRRNPDGRSILFTLGKK